MTPVYLRSPGTHGRSGAPEEERVPSPGGGGRPQTDPDPQTERLPRPAGGDHGQSGARPTSRE